MSFYYPLFLNRTVWQFRPFCDPIRSHILVHYWQLLKLSSCLGFRPIVSSDEMLSYTTLLIMRFEIMKSWHVYYNVCGCVTLSSQTSQYHPSLILWENQETDLNKITEIRTLRRSKSWYCEVWLLCNLSVTKYFLVLQFVPWPGWHVE